MSDNVYIGRRCAAVSKPPALKPVSKVVLWIDNQNCYEAGDSTGREIEITCPYGTQAMAEDLLRKLSGYKYQPLTADDALLDPAAELGDAVTVDGCYTVMASMDLTFDGLLTGDIAAPGAVELAQEYQFSDNEKILSRKIARNRSLISKTAEEIRMEVSGLVDGEGGINQTIAALQLDLDGIDLKYQQKIEGYTDEEGNFVNGLQQTIAALELGLSGIDLKYQQKIEGYTDEEGNFVDGLQQTIAALKLGADGFKVNVEGALGTDADGNLEKVSSSITAALGKLEFSATSTEGKTTLTLAGGGVSLKSDEFNLSVDAVNISGELTADQLHLGGMLTVYDGINSDDVGGYIGYDNGFNSSWGIGIRTYAPDRYGNTQGPQFVCTDSAARVSYTTVSGRNTADTSVVCKANTLSLTGYKMIQMAIDGSVLVDLDEDGLYPAASNLTLGLKILPWADVYAAGTSMSDLLARVKALEGK